MANSTSSPTMSLSTCCPTNISCLSNSCLKVRSQAAAAFNKLDIPTLSSDLAPDASCFKLCKNSSVLDSTRDKANSSVP